MASALCRDCRSHSSHYRVRSDVISRPAQFRGLDVLMPGAAWLHPFPN